MTTVHIRPQSFVTMIIIIRSYKCSYSTSTSIIQWVIQTLMITQNHNIIIKDIIIKDILLVTIIILNRSQSAEITILSSPPLVLAGLLLSSLHHYHQYHQFHHYYSYTRHGVIHVLNVIITILIFVVGWSFKAVGILIIHSVDIFFCNLRLDDLFWLCAVFW